VRLWPPSVNERAQEGPVELKPRPGTSVGDRPTLDKSAQSEKTGRTQPEKI